jgi:hypothetical protein
MIENKGIAIASAVDALGFIYVLQGSPPISWPFNGKELDLSSTLVFVANGRLNLNTMKFTTPI